MLPLKGNFTSPRQLQTTYLRSCRISMPPRLYATQKCILMPFSLTVTLIFIGMGTMYLTWHVLRHTRDYMDSIYLPAMAFLLGRDQWYFLMQQSVLILPLTSAIQGLCQGQSQRLMINNKALVHGVLDEISSFSILTREFLCRGLESLVKVLC